MDAADAESAEAIKVEKIGRDAYIGVHRADGSLSGYGGTEPSTSTISFRRPGHWFTLIRQRPMSVPE